MLGFPANPRSGVISRLGSQEAFAQIATLDTGIVPDAPLILENVSQIAMLCHRFGETTVQTPETMDSNIFPRVDTESLTLQNSGLSKTKNLDENFSE